MNAKLFFTSSNEHNLPPTKDFHIPPNPIPPDIHTNAIPDSGASVSIISKHALRQLGITNVKQLDSPIPIETANGDITFVTQYVELGPIIGRVHILEGAQETLLSVREMSKNSLYKFCFDGEYASILNPDGTSVLSTAYSKTKKSYNFDIRDLVNLPIINPSPTFPQATLHMVMANKQAKYITENLSQRVLWLHKKMGHASPENMIHAIRHAQWQNVDEDITPTVIEKVFQKMNCIACSLAKRNRLSSTRGTGTRPNEPGHTISIDYQGPIAPTCARGMNGFYLATCTTTKYVHSFTCSSKSAENLCLVVEEIRKFYKRYEWPVKIIRTDAGSSEDSATFQNYLIDHSMEHQPAGVDEQNENPVERDVQECIKGVGAILLDQTNLGASSWDLALRYWCETRNDTPNSTNPEMTPIYRVTGHKPNTDHRYPFGTLVSVHITGTRTNKFQNANELGIAVGVSGYDNKAIRVVIPGRFHDDYERIHVRPIKTGKDRLKNIPESLQPSISHDGITFHSLVNEDITPSEAISSQQINYHDITSSSSQEDSTTSETPFPREQKAATSHLHTQEAIPNEPPRTRRKTTYFNSPVPQKVYSVYAERPNQYEILHQILAVKPHISSLQTLQNLISGIDKSPPRPFSRHEIEKACLTKRRTRDENNPTVKQALHLSNWGAEWQPAIDAEMTNLNNFGTGTPILKRDIPKGAQIIPSKMDLTTKYNTDAQRSIKKRKARLVILGNLEKSPADYDCFSPTGVDKSVHLLLALAAQHNLHIRSADITGAFLNAQIDGDIYIQLPTDLSNEPIYWKLNRSLYGLKRAPKLWNDHLCKHLLEKGYQQSKLDQCTFYKRTDTSFIMFVVHVDDFIIAADTAQTIDTLIADLRDDGDKFVVTTNDNVESILGVRIDRDNDGTIHLSQPSQIRKAFDYITPLKTPNYHTRSYNTPMAFTFSDLDQDNSPLLTDTPIHDGKSTKSHFLAILGMLLYCVRSRPDIAFAVSKLATRFPKATEKDFAALLRVSDYLYTTIDHTMSFLPGNKIQCDTVGQLFAWSDASFNCHPDSKSHTGICFSLGLGNGIFWSKSNKQKTVALSSCEAEMYAATEATTAILWFRKILEELGFAQTQPTVLFSDNQSTIQLSTNRTGKHSRIKHFILRVNFMLEKVAEQMIQLKYMDTENMVADVLTKSLSPAIHNKHTSTLLRQP